MNAAFSIISTPSGISNFSIILSSKADSLICFKESGSLTEIRTVFLNEDFQISVIGFQSRVEGIVISLSKHWYPTITAHQNHACESAIVKQLDFVSAKVKADKSHKDRILIAVSCFKFFFILVSE